MALTVGDREVRPLTADEVLRMVEAGILSEDEPLELLHGALTAVPVKSPDHEAVKSRLFAWLGAGASAGRYVLRVESPILVPDGMSLPEPDVAVLERPPSPTAHPTTALLVIEVAVTSHRVDTRIKPPLYAQAGVPEYWVVDVPGRRVRACRRPEGGRYAEEAIMEDGPLQPTHVEAEPLDVTALLAGLEPGRRGGDAVV